MGHSGLIYMYKTVTQDYGEALNDHYLIFKIGNSYYLTKPQKQFRFMTIIVIN